MFKSPRFSAHVVFEAHPLTLILKRASASRPSGEWNDDDYDVLADRLSFTSAKAQAFSCVSRYAPGQVDSEVFEQQRYSKWGGPEQLRSSNARSNGDGCCCVT